MSGMQGFNFLLGTEELVPECLRLGNFIFTPVTVSGGMEKIYSFKNYAVQGSMVTPIFICGNFQKGDNFSVWYEPEKETSGQKPANLTLNQICTVFG